MQFIGDFTGKFSDDESDAEISHEKPRTYIKDYEIRFTICF